MNRTGKTGMIIRILLTAFFVSAVMVLFAQHKINIFISGMDEAAPSKVTYGTVDNGKDFQLGEDSLRKGRILLLIPDSVKPGIVSVIFSGDMPVSDLKVIYTREDANLTFTPASGKTKFVVSGSGETPAYYSSRQKTDSIVKRIMKFREISSGFKSDDGFAAKTLIFLNKEKAALDSFYTDLHKTHGESLFLHFLDGLRYYFPDPLLPVAQQRKDLLDHFFDYFNPLDSLLLRSTLYNAKVEDFLEMSTGNSSETLEADLKTAVDMFMKKVSANEKISGTAARLMRKWLNKYGFDEVLEYLDQNYLATQCTADSDIDLQERLAAYKRLAKGNTAPEIMWIGENNLPQKLSGLAADNTVILFWATWCEHCQQLLPGLYNYLEGAAGIKVIAIGLDDDEALWKKVTKSFPGWVHLRAPEKWKNDYVKLYGISATPTMFLTDKNHKIVQRIKDLEGLQEALKLK